MKIESTAHYWNIVKRMLTERGLLECYPSEGVEIVKDFSFWLYSTIAHKDLFRHYKMRSPGENFTFRIRSISTSQEFTKLFNEYSQLQADVIQFIASKGKILRHTLLDVLKFENEQVIIAPFFDKVEFLECFTKLCEKLTYQYGIYLFFDKNNSLCYIGKSTNLGQRIAASFIERKEYAFKVKIIIPKSIADIHVLEPYLIIKHKPYLNTEFTCTEFTTYELEVPEPVLESLIIK